MAPYARTWSIPKTVVQVMAWCHADLVLVHHMASLGHHESKQNIMKSHLHRTYFAETRTLPKASFGRQVLLLPVSVSLCLCVNHKFVSTLTRHPFKLGSHNLNQSWNAPSLRSILILGWLTLTFNVKFNLKMKIWWMSGFSTRVNTSIRVNTKAIFDSSQFHQRRVGLVFKAW